MTPTSLVTAQNSADSHASADSVLSNHVTPLESAGTFDDGHGDFGNSVSMVCKQTMDLTIAGGLIMMTLPLFLLTAAAIKLTSRGPVFYVQERVGKSGQKFRFFKFRTMRHDADDKAHRDFARDFIQGSQKPQAPMNGSGNAVAHAATASVPIHGNGHVNGFVSRQTNGDGEGGGNNHSKRMKANGKIYKMTADPRVTSVGRFLRRTSLDELPQIFNVLRGEMSMVGPRPPVPYEVEHYQEWHKRRLSAKPGITGLWQVSGRSSVPFDEMVHGSAYHGQDASGDGQGRGRLLIHTFRADSSYAGGDHTVRERTKAMLRVGVIGCGYWGPNLIRNFGIANRSSVVMAADLDTSRLHHMQGLYPHLRTTTDHQELLESQDIDAVVIATPVSTHHPLTMQALRANKHVFVEKPLAGSREHCMEMAAEAHKRNLTLMVGHTFVYTAAVNKIRELIQNEALGDIYYISSQRVNLGVFQKDINVIWDLAPHDISIMNEVLQMRPEKVSAHGKSFIRPGIEDVAFIDLEYPNGVITNIHVSWLDPNKIRRTTVVGSKKMLVYDDVSSLEKIRVYDKGVDVPPHYDSFGEFKLSYRFGDILIPRLDESEPLKVECRHFVDCVESCERPRSNAEEGLAVVAVLEAACESLRKNGEQVDVGYPVLES